MVRTALATLEEVDLVCFLIEADRPENDENDLILKNLKRAGKPVVLAINKIDLVPRAELLPVIGRYSQLFPFREIIPISALSGDGVEILAEEILRMLPEGPPLFPEDMVTDQTERFLVSEFIREKILHRTREEIPYAAAVVIEEFKEKEEKNLVVIRATILVERDSQKGILIGEKGRTLKEIGRLAREEIESLLGTKVFLELWVKVEKNWRDDPRALRRLGY
jgi:GTP-binding protein Era